MLRAPAGTGVPSRDAAAATLPPGWPVVLLFAGFPLWWLLGLGSFVWPLVTGPLVIWLVMRRPRMPRGFVLWVLFVLWMLASWMQLEGGPHHLVFIYRAVIYVSASILFLYVYNLPRDPRVDRRIVQAMVVFWFAVVIGGLLGLMFPDVSVHGPIEGLLPRGLLANEWVHDMAHIRFAQIHDFLGYPLPRASAPFPYTNEWASNLSLLTPFALLALGNARTVARRAVLLGALVASLVPILTSVNRGLWLGLGAGLLYALLRHPGSPLVARVARVGVVVLVLGGTLLLTPLGGVVADRFANPHSNEGRLDLYEEAGRGALASPLFGYGAPRPSAVNRYLPSVGTHGQFWLVLFSHGIPALLLFVGWLVWVAWRTRAAPTRIALWCHVAFVIALVEMVYYGLVPTEIHILMVAAALGLRAMEPRAQAQTAGP